MLPFAEVSPGGAGQVIPARAQTCASATNRTWCIPKP